MNSNFIIKAMCWSVGLIVVLASLLAGLWFHPFITILVIFAGWIFTMRFLDPPENWN